MSGIEELIAQTGATVTIKPAEGGPGAGLEVIAHQKRLYNPQQTVEARSDVTVRVVRPTLEEAAGAILQAMAPLVRQEAPPA